MVLAIRLAACVGGSMPMGDPGGSPGADTHAPVDTAGVHSGRPTSDTGDSGAQHATGDTGETWLVFPACQPDGPPPVPWTCGQVLGCFTTPAGPYRVDMLWLRSDQTYEVWIEGDAYECGCFDCTGDQIIDRTWGHGPMAYDPLTDTVTGRFGQLYTRHGDENDPLCAQLAECY